MRSSSLRYVESAFGVEARDRMLAAKRESASKATAILGLGARTDAELYAKGPLLLFDLENRIGRQKFDQVLRNLANNPPSVTAEFLDALATVAGADPSRDFERRLRE